MTMPESGTQGASTWLIFVFLTIVCWGTYGVFLHAGQSTMGDAEFGRYKAFLWVGLAYLFLGIVAPTAIIVMGGGDWSMTGKGIAWSILAGLGGAVGALSVLLAFGAKGHPAVVMSLIFAGAPIVNAVVAFAMHPPAGGLSTIRWQFVLGILLAAGGGLMVTYFRPGTAPPPKTISDAADIGGDAVEP